MGKVTGFLEYPRRTSKTRPVEERLKDYKEVYLDMPVKEVMIQAARCMDCGVPTCHTHVRGCPINNLIPEWNHLVYRNYWDDAAKKLALTNNFPDITGRICPAPCESACILGINKPPVSIKEIEKKISDRAWDEGRYKPIKPPMKTGKRVAIIGSGPAGLAAAQQLTRVGHEVIVFEKEDRIGGLLRYGIPDFKMEKSILDRNLDLMRQEGTIFEPNTCIGKDISITKLRKEFDAIVIAIGCEKPRELGIPGEKLKGVHFAMEFLVQQNRVIAGDTIPPEKRITAKGKNVLIIGGGDTGADCLGVSLRQGAKHVYQFVLYPKPTFLPYSSSHEEGGERIWSVECVELIGDENQHVRKAKAVNLQWGTPLKINGRRNYRRLEETEFTINVDLVLIAIGYERPYHEYIFDDLPLQLTPRNTIAIDKNYQTSVPGIFAAGDAMRGQSLVVWAIRDGRLAARGVDQYLMGRTIL